LLKLVRHIYIIPNAKWESATALIIVYDFFSESEKNVKLILLLIMNIYTRNK